MGIYSEFTFTSANGKADIHAAQWIPTYGVRGIVQIAHGIADHLGRYDRLARFLCEKGFVVFGCDHIGHGKSVIENENLGYCGENGGWGIMVSDMHKLHELARIKYPHVPYFIFGHSMGSFLTRTYMIRYGSDISGVILSGTGQQPKTALALSKALVDVEVQTHGGRYVSERMNKLIFGKYNTGIIALKSPFDWISRDEALVEAYTKDEFCGYIPSSALFRDMLEGMLYISTSRNIKRMQKDLPVFFISGDKDPVGGFGRGVIRAYRSFLDAGMSDVYMKLYHGARHELINETNYQEVFEDIINWLETKV